MPANDPTGAARAVQGDEQRVADRRRAGRALRPRRAAPAAVSSARPARRSRRSRTTRSTRRSTTRRLRPPASSPAARRTGGAAGSTCPTADTYQWELQYNVPNANVTFDFDNAASPATGRARDAHAGERAEHLRRDHARDADERRLHAGAADEPGLLDRHDGDDLRGAARRSAGTRCGSRSTRARSRRRSASGSRSRASRATRPTPRRPPPARARRSCSSTPAAARATRAASPAGTPYDGHTISAVTAMSAANVDLINAVAAANPNTIVVINNDNPVDTSWIGSVKAVLDMWFAGQEGGTSTARILLGLANPSGHTALTWPANRTDTIWGYNEPADAPLPGLDRRTAPRAAERQRRLRRHGQSGLARVPGRRRHERVRGHLHRLPLLRQARHHAAVPVRLGPVVHERSRSRT